MENKFAQLNRLSKQHDRLVGSVKIMDLDGLSSKHLTNTGRNYLTAAIHISQAHYPEMLNKLIIINTPWVFNMIWAIVKPWLHERTLAKVRHFHIPIDILFFFAVLNNKFS
jgi:23S rRNA A2030 N6-methylase RlmJ